jgi:hypothetical protein
VSDQIKGTPQASGSVSRLFRPVSITGGSPESSSTPLAVSGNPKPLAAVPEVTHIHRYFLIDTIYYGTESNADAIHVKYVFEWLNWIDTTKTSVCRV